MARNEAAAACRPETGSVPERACPSLYRRRRRAGDTALSALIWLASLITVLTLAGLIGYILINGLTHISWDFLTGTYSAIHKDRQLSLIHI